MRLTELEPSFLKIVDSGHRHTDDINADGLWLLCPTCWLKNSGIGTHGIICWQPHVDASRSPGPGRWKIHGTGYNDLTLDNGPGNASSVWLKGGCDAHFHIRDGNIEMC